MPLLEGRGGHYILPNAGYLIVGRNTDDLLYKVRAEGADVEILLAHGFKIIEEDAPPAPEAPVEAPAPPAPAPEPAPKKKASKSNVMTTADFAPVNREAIKSEQ